MWPGKWTRSIFSLFLINFGNYFLVFSRTFTGFCRVILFQKASRMLPYLCVDSLVPHTDSFDPLCCCSWLVQFTAKARFRHIENTACWRLVLLFFSGLTRLNVSVFEHWIEWIGVNTRVISNNCCLLAFKIRLWRQINTSNFLLFLHIRSNP